MSTIDPDAAKRQRDLVPMTPRDLIRVAVVLFLCAAAMAFATTANPAHLSAEQEFRAGNIVGLVGTFVPFPIMIVLLIDTMPKLQRVPRLPGLELTPGVVLLGAALGLSLVAEPPAWIGSPRATTMSLIAAGVGLLALLGGVRGWRSRVRRLDFEEAAMRTVEPVVGEVTNQGWKSFDESSAILTKTTYAFVDMSGQRRYVKRPSRILRDDPMVDGELVDVWYDRNNPGDADRIVIRRRPGRL